MGFRRAGRAFGITVVAALIGVTLPATAAHADPAGGSIVVTITTPDGVPANVEIDGATHRMVTKQAHGTTQSKGVLVPAGSYTITPDPALYHGSQYFGSSSPRSVTVGSGQSVSVTVSYAGDPTAASDLRLTAFSTSSVSFAWSADSNGPFSLRRTPGKRPATSPQGGTKVSTGDHSATDSGLSPGGTYSYALFTMVRGTWVGPLTLTLTTTPPAGTTAATYVTTPGTLLAAADDIAQEATTGDGVLVTFSPAVVMPQVGSAVVLPGSAVLKGGYVGAVVSISEDGRTALLHATSMDAAFAYYTLKVPSFSSGEIPLTPSEASSSSSTSSGTSKSLMAKSATVPNCFGGSSEFSVSFDPKLDLHGSFDATITHGWLNIPDGATMSASLGATVGASLGVTSQVAVTCRANLRRVDYQVAVEPVPVTLDFEPIVQLSLGGGVDIRNIGMNVTAGVAFSAELGVGGASLTTDPFTDGDVLQPTVVSNAGVQATLGGDLVFGPGAATEAAGVVAGVSGTLNPIKGSFGPVSSQTGETSNTCLVAELGGDAALGLKAKAWIGKFDASAAFTLWDDSWTYGTWHFPENCDGSEPPTDPGQSVLGPGVTKVDDSTTGAASQVGYVSGLVPGQSSWLLSSGNVGDAVGSPGGFASTDLGGPGDAELSGLSGRPTYDAAAYQVTLVPSGSTLHVKYAFASEEYPEFVGSAFNDVMEVSVNGVNCATVPGTATPVSINTINDHTNSRYYVDNAAGAAGYNTTYDGLTVPLTCDVPVTPGQQVTVRIAVADASDHVYDSGVALLDNGIWSD